MTPNWTLLVNVISKQQQKWQWHLYQYVFCIGTQLRQYWRSEANTTVWAPRPPSIFSFCSNKHNPTLLITRQLGTNLVPRKSWGYRALRFQSSPFLGRKYIRDILASIYTALRRKTLEWGTENHFFLRGETILRPWVPNIKNIKVVTYGSPKAVSQWKVLLKYGNDKGSNTVAHLRNCPISSRQRWAMVM